MLLPIILIPISSCLHNISNTIGNSYILINGNVIFNQLEIEHACIKGIKYVNSSIYLHRFAYN